MNQAHEEDFLTDNSNCARALTGRCRLHLQMIAWCLGALLVITGRSVKGQAGTVDRSFTPSSELGLGFRATMTLAPDGAVILASRERDGVIWIRRLDEHGAIDPSFHSPQFDSTSVDCLTAQADGSLLVCGYFTHVDGLPRPGLARLRPDGTVDAGFDPGSGALGLITAMAARTNGQVIVLGRFSTFNGVNRAGLVRLNADGSIDPSFDPGTGANWSANVVAVQPDGKVVVGGSFWSFNGVSRLGVVRLNLDGSVDPTFVPALITIGEVHAVALQPDGRVVVSGDELRTDAGTPNVTRLNSNGSLDTTFQPGAGFGESSRYVDSLAVQPDGKILVGGDFTAFAGVKAEGIVRLNRDGTLDPRYDPGSLGQQLHLHVVGLQPNGGVIAMRQYVGAGGQYHQDLLRLQGGDTSAYAGRLQFNPIYYDVGETSGVVAVQVNRTRATTGAAEVRFETRGDEMFYRASATAGLDYTARTETLTLTNGQTNATILIPILDDTVAEPPEYFNVTLLQPGLGTTIGTDNTAFVQILENDSAFEFSQSRYSVRESGGSVNLRVERRGVATPQATVHFMTLPESATPGADFISQSGTLTFLPGESVQGINVTILEDQDREGLEMFRVVLENPTGGALLAPVSTAVVEIVDNDDDGPGSLVRLFDPRVGLESFSSIQQLAGYANGDVLIAGILESFFGPYRIGMVRVQPDGTPDNRFQLDPAFSEYPTAMLLQTDDQIVYARSQGLARLNANGSMDPSFDIPISPENGPFHPVIAALAQDDQGRLLVGGALRSLAGVDRTGLARLDTNGTIDLAFNPLLACTNGFSGDGPGVFVLAVQTDHKILIAGTFDLVDGVARHNLARLNGDGSLDAVFDPGRIAGDFRTPYHPGVTAMAVQPDGKLLLAGDWSLVRGVRGMGVIRLEADGSLDSSFTPALVEEDQVWQIALQNNGKILLRLGYAPLRGLHRFGLARLNADGSIDATFDPGPSFDALGVQALLVESSGDLLMAGYLRTADGASPKLVRLRGDNAAAFGRCEFHQAEFKAWASNAVATIVVDRHAGAVGAATVYYAAIDGTSTNGLDFVLAPGSVTFSPGETSKTFNVTILKDRLKALPEQLTLQLQAGTGAVLGSQSSATLTILRHPGGLLDESFEPRTAYSLRGAPGEKILTHIIDYLADDGAQLPWSRLNSDGIWEAGFDFDAWYLGPVDDLMVRGDGAISLYRRSGGVEGRLTRALSDGSADPDFQIYSGAMTAMALEAGGKLILNRAEYLEHGRNVLLRLNVDGSLDPTFHSQLVDNPDGSSVVWQLVLQADGKILVGGRFSSIAGAQRQNLARLNRDGTLDPSFAATAVDSMPDAIVLQSDGKIVVAYTGSGEFGERPLVRRLRSDGSLDPTFQAELGYGASVRTLLVQGDGKILVGGQQLLQLHPDWFGYLGMVRLQPNGAVDLSFGSEQEVTSALLQADGRVVVAGSGSLVRLLNDSGVGAGRVAFEIGSFQVSETDHPTVTLTVRRTGGSRGAVSVNYGSTGTATEGADFYISGDTVRFADGDTTPQAITIQIHDDMLAEPPETIRVMLGNPIGGVVLGEQSFADIRIDDNDTAVEFSQSVYEVREREHEIVVEARRLGAVDRAFSVSLFTAPVTATAGLDYFSQNTVLNFAAGDTNKMFSIPLFDDGETESNETFRVVLSAPTAGVFLGSNAQALVVIIDSDRPGTLDLQFDPDPIVESYFAVNLPFYIRLGIRCMALQSDGRILLGGAFADRWSFFPLTVQGLVRLLPNGALDGSFVPEGLNNPSGDPIEVTAIALGSDGAIWLAFHTLPLGGNGLPDLTGTHLVRLGEEGVRDASFQTTFDGTSIDALALEPDGRILAGGSFSSVNGVARRGLVRLFPDGRVDLGFDPGTGVILRQPNGRFHALALQPDNRILLAGEFNQVNGVDRNGVARLEHDGAVDRTFDPGEGPSYPFNQWTAEALLLQPDGRMVVAGTFDSFDGIPRTGLVRLQADGTLDSSFDPGRIAFPEVPVNAVYVSVLAPARHGKILIGGNFTQINGVPRNKLARLNSDGSLDFGFAPELGGWDVQVLAEEASGQILVGGMFSGADGIGRPGLARLNGGVFQFEFDSVKPLASGRVRLRFEMPRAQKWLIEGSPDLLHWQVVSPTRPLVDIGEFTDTAAADNEKRFYRAVKIP